MKNNIKIKPFTCAVARFCSDVCWALVGVRRGQGQDIGAHSPAGPSPPPAVTWGHIMVRGWSVEVMMCHLYVPLFVIGSSISPARSLSSSSLAAELNCWLLMLAASASSRAWALTNCSSQYLRLLQILSKMMRF